ncbi:Amidophosphoribosyltransferase precursor [Slackia heliotrinireducens]|uniref:Amidophosphoribosyltransferase n=1 Tax=Slackia heliotrinireducens (strain ATCC 29202 / DSM 20476 / NCTC 11029 / RHS 1) TaxID=471855 RepID=C7N1F4_SLAHD|nr:amidophosphoribosyltransferase [Slackia heliotrinireducens]ACV21246.1 amidophosphoribosyltransferase [Slackia heliotrinireducens DSM 20476]VEG98680.1 Amidophosphoribosyltransferase precursor [Slackia heliotrinireducens]
MATSILPGEAPDRPQEECAVFGVFSPTDDVARLTCFGLQALQHRGQESAGIAVGDGETVTVMKDLGLVTQIFDEGSLAALQGDVAVGHCRYATSGISDAWFSAQPHMSAIDEVMVALAHNGTLVDTEPIRERLEARGVEFRAGTDSEVACQAIGYYTRETHHLTEGIKQTMELIKGAYAMVLASPTALYAFRDPNGIRPLCLGKLPGDRGWVVSSETCGLDIVGAEFVRDVNPGEIIRINSTGISTLQALEPGPSRGCIFEYVYFARPDSVIDGQSVYQARRAMGRILAEEAPAQADLVLGVPDSGVPGALGFAEASGIEYTDGIVKNRYVGRTFIQPTQEMRQLGVRIKLNPLPSVISGKRLVVVDDSIVRGTTSKKLVEMLRAAGAAEVHLRIVSPPTAWPCFYGVDTPTQGQLIAAVKSNQEMCEYIGCDSLAFISIDGLRRAVGGANHETFCEACFTGDYIVPLPESLTDIAFIKKEK